MNDSRLWEIKDDIEIAMRGVRNITDGPRISPPNESDKAYALLQHLVVAHRQVVELIHRDMPLCLTYSGFGSCCYRQVEHDGSHRSEWGNTWTDESDRLAGDAIAKSMQGRRD